RRLGLLSSRSIFSNVVPTTTIGGVRYAGTEAAAAPAPTASAPVGVPTPATTREQRFSRPGYRPRAVPPPGHAERIWVYNHILDNLTVYSLTQEMNPTKAFRQFAFTGKKLVPSKLRKDYWRPLAVIEFGEGKGDVGRSVFQKLRELKKRHLLEWEDPALLQMSRRERGRALNDQRGTFVADLAAVLAGRGKGNLMVKPATGAETAEGADKKKEEEKEEEGGNAPGVAKVPASRLHQATVYWANEQDKYYAREWSDNVTHVIGLPEKGVKKKAAQQAAAEEGE
ncbi:mitochondrial 54S ribosomal protein mL67, partial [Thermothelomyces heterothallicus CBS 202.75]|uniref:mitochondrial 54S ribosomal protein mL67 n=1 Tax=Thermothelomyces heterothallicus CBS 202.75 TaxID=1149848 RepID=UPI0037441182